MNSSSDIWLFIGRFHPLVLHLPIALILLLAMLESVARVRKLAHATTNAGLILCLAIAASLVTALFGWLLSLGGGYDAKLLQWHKWTGIATAGACLVTGAFYYTNRRILYRASLTASCIVLAIASHFGGSLTHGSDYLARYAPAPLRPLLGGAAPVKPAQAKPLDLSQVRAFSDVVQPVLAGKCVECHGPEKSKGSLRLDSLAGIAKGGQTGPGMAQVLKRIHLPDTDEDHMPPNGKPDLDQNELALLEWWAQSGLAEDKHLIDVKPPPSIKRLVAARLGIAMPAVAEAKPLNTVLPIAAAVAGELGIAASTISPSDPWLQVNASPAGTNFVDCDLAKLVAFGPNIRWLDLAGTGITDAGMSNLIFMPNLARLHLERTAITDRALDQLPALDKLEYLNLYATAVSDEGLKNLRGMPALKQVYLWQTKVSAPGAQAFADTLMDKDSVNRWTEEIQQLQAKIRLAQVTVDLGATQIAVATNATTTNLVSIADTKPINGKCPVTGTPVTASKTVVYDGAVIAFCCDNCKAKFQQDPKPYLSALPAPHTETKPEKN